MTGKVTRTGWGLATACILGLGLFLCGDQVSPRHLTCTDLLNMPIEDLMEVHIVSRIEGQGRAHKLGEPSVSALPETPFTARFRTATFS